MLTLYTSHCNQHFHIQLYYSLGTVTRVCAGRSRVRISAVTTDISPKRPDRLWGLARLLFNSYRDSFPEVRRPQREVACSHLSGAEVKNEWG